MKNYEVKIVLNIRAENPLDAAKKGCEILLYNNEARTMIYDVEDEDSGEKFTVDLSEETISPDN